MRISQLLRRGVVAGAAAGLAAALMMWLLVEPVIRRALAIEDARGVGHHHGHDEPLVSRTVQVFAGAFTAVVVGVLVGLVFAVVFAQVQHRLPGGSVFGRSVALAALGFGVFSLLPALKVPANPPAVGDSATVTQRTLIYLLTILVGLLVVGVVSCLDRLLRNRRLPAPRRCTVDALAVVGCVALVILVLPDSPDVIPGDVPAAVIWDFRLVSLAHLGTMWAVLGLGFGMLAQPQVKHPQEAPAASA